MEKTLTLLINIIVKIFNNLDLCKLLFIEYKKILKKSQNNDKITLNENLQCFKDKFQEIYEKAENDKIIKENPDISTDYYGFILCYNCYYDFSKFSELVKHIYAQDSDILFQILLAYKSYLKKEIKKLDGREKEINEKKNK